MAKLSFFRSQTVRQATALLAVTSLLSNGLGLARNLVFNRVIPQGELDVYFASFRLADLILNILIIGAISSAVIPTVSALVAAKKEKEAHDITNQLITWGTLAMLAVIGLLWAAMPWIIEYVLVPGFQDNRLAETITLSRLLLLQALFFSWSLIVGGLLNSYRRFAGYALAPLVYNVSLITGGILAGRYGLHALIYAVIGGAFCHFLIQFYEAYRMGYRPKVNLEISPEFKAITRLMAPRSASQGVNQLVLLVYTNLSSRLPYGSLTIFNNMNDLQTTPTVIVANSLATASFPELSAKFSQGKVDEVNDLVNKVIRACVYTLLPLAVLGLVLRAQIARLYFGIGAADWGLTIVAISTLAWFMVGIVPSALVAVLARVFYASNDTRTPMLINVVTAAIGISLSWVAVMRFNGDVSTLALSEAAIAVSQASLYLFILHRRQAVDLKLDTLTGKRYAYVIGGIAVAASSWLTLRAVDAIYGLTHFVGTDKIIGLFIQTAIATAVAGLAYWQCTKAARRTE